MTGLKELYAFILFKVEIVSTEKNNDIYAFKGDFQLLKPCV